MTMIDADKDPSVDPWWFVFQFRTMMLIFIFLSCFFFALSPGNLLDSISFRDRPRTRYLNRSMSVFKVV